MWQMQQEQNPEQPANWIMIWFPILQNYVDVQTNLAKRGNVTIRIMDASGKILISNSEIVESGKQSIKINTEKLIQGTYIVEVQSDNSKSAQKLLISK
jgi:hypothetical protein